MTQVSTAPLRRFLDLMTCYEPKNQEDWKAIYWMYYGSKPSETEKVIVHIDKEKNRGYMWGILKDGVQPK